MNLRIKIFFGCFLCLSIISDHINAQDKTPDSAVFYNEVKTYTNPVLPGDHPDPTLLKAGGDLDMELLASSNETGKIEIWLDDLKFGKPPAVIPVSPTGKNKWKIFNQHNLFIKTIRFISVAK